MPENRMDDPATIPWMRIYMAGLGERPQEWLTQWLKRLSIVAVVDLRRTPFAGGGPEWFCEPYLRVAMDRLGVQYHLGGKNLGEVEPTEESDRIRQRQQALDDPALRAYAEYSQTHPFETGISLLLNLARRFPTLMLVGEEDPLGGHGLILADYLTLAGHEVLVLGEEAFEIHQQHPSVRRESNTLCYSQKRRWFNK
ncbi:DUF488 family protein [Magnetococcales bacterium HHB-1]